MEGITQSLAYPSLPLSWARQRSPAARRDHLAGSAFLPKFLPISVQRLRVELLNHGTTTSIGVVMTIFLYYCISLCTGKCVPLESPPARFLRKLQKINPKCRTLQASNNLAKSFPSIQLSKLLTLIVDKIVVRVCACGLVVPLYTTTCSILCNIQG